MKAVNVTLACIVISLVLSCQGRVKKDTIQLDKVESLLEQQPDSAFAMLRNLMA